METRSQPPYGSREIAEHAEQATKIPKRSGQLHQIKRTIEDKQICRGGCRQRWPPHISTSSFSLPNRQSHHKNQTSIRRRRQIQIWTELELRFGDRTKS
jgi:hypothetical protein